MELNKRLHENIFYYTNVVKDPAWILENLERLDSVQESYIAISKWIDDSCDRQRKDLQFAKRNDVVGKDSKIVKEIIETMRNAIESVASQYVIDNNLNILPNISPFLDMCKYPPGGSLGLHHDTQDGDMNLMYSIVLYFNDDHEGGEISFMIDENNKNRPGQDINDSSIDFWLKPEAGSALVFPSTHPYLHQSHPVKSGHKYISTAFIFVDGYDPFNRQHVEAYKKKDV